MPTRYQIFSFFALLLLLTLLLPASSQAQAPAPDQSFPKLLADGQFVLGPNVGDFKVQAYLQQKKSPLFPYSAIIEERAYYYSLNPRLLLALLELQYGLVTGQPKAGVDPAQYLDEKKLYTLVDQLGQNLALPFYEQLYAQQDLGNISPSPERQTSDSSLTPNAGTYALLSVLSPRAKQSGQPGAVESPSGFGPIYQQLFPDDDPLDERNQLDPRATPPADFLKLPFKSGETWRMSGGPHGWSTGYDTPWSSVDFAPSGHSGCKTIPTSNWVAAAAKGTVEYHSSYFIRINHGNGWATDYFHLANLKVTKGNVEKDTKIANPSCNGGIATGAHVHFATVYNGVRQAIHGTSLEGWVVNKGASAYTGSLKKNTSTIPVNSSVKSTWAPPPPTKIEVVVEQPTLSPGYSGCASSNWDRRSNNRGHYFYLTLNTNSSSQATNSGIWRPNLPQTGQYRVEAYIASHNGNWCGGSVEYDTSDARYTIYHAGGSSAVKGNQRPLYNEWLNLGTFTFNAGTGGYVRLRDLNSETNLSRTVSFSAMRFTYQGTVPDSTMPTGTITAPANNTQFGPGTISFTANASDNPGGSGVKEVNFYIRYAAPFSANWYNVGTDTTSPYTANWSTKPGLRSQLLEFGIHVVDKAGNYCIDPGTGYTCYNATSKRLVVFKESRNNPNVTENWIPKDFRFYLNQLSLGSDGNQKCAGATAAMLLAMNRKIGGDYTSMKNAANSIHQDLAGNLLASNLVAPINKRGLKVEAKEYDKSSGWAKIKQEINAGRPVIMLSAKLTNAGHYVVVVGYREAGSVREVIVYDPFGRWKGLQITENYDKNSTSSDSFKGQWAYYDLDKIWGTDRGLPWNWGKSSLITVVSGQAATLDSTIQKAIEPSTDPDMVSPEPEDIVTYNGVVTDISYNVFLPHITK